MTDGSQPWKGPASPRTLRAADYQDAAARLGCDVPAIRAIWEVEAAGQYFRPDGSVVRRFEPHHFPRDLWDQIGFQPRPRETPWRASLRLSSEAMFQSAAARDLRAALRASSWGAPQIMGFNAQACGFADAREMVEQMARGAPRQVQAFVRLIEGWGLAPAIRGHDWHAFAARYNGSGQVAEYARRIEAAYRRHSGGERSAVVLQPGARGGAVAELQRALGIEDDGAFGPLTVAAVMRFQERHGLAVDGVVGHRTWTALRAASPAPPSPPAQETPADRLADVTAQITGAGAAVTGLAGALGSVRETIPPEMFAVLIWGAAGLAVAWAAAWGLRRLRAGALL